MHGSPGGPLGALLLIAPLAAIPVFAIVGVPQFAPLSASPSDDDDFADPGDSVASLEAGPAAAPCKSRARDDIFAPLSDPSPRPDPAARPPGRGRQVAAATDVRSRLPNPAQPLPPPEALDNWEIRSNPGTIASPHRADDDVPGKPGKTPRAAGNPSEELQIPPDELEEGQVSAAGFSPDLLKPEPGRPRASGRAAEKGSVAPPPSPTPRLDPLQAKNADSSDSPLQSLEMAAEMTPEQSGWQAAARRLKELGIRKYRLDAQIEEQTFIFFCIFVSPDNVRIVRRFEAEADTPLEAVQQALEQIDDWRARGTSDKFAALPPEE
jgi:hypothetical protein